MVCGIFWLATSLPSTFSTPVPPLPKPGPSYVKSKDDGVLARRQRVLPFPAEALKVEEVVEEHRLALEQVEAVAAEAATQVTSIPSAPPWGSPPRR